MGDTSALQLEAEFDVIVCSDLFNDLWHVQSVLEKMSIHCHLRTRLIINSYSRLREDPRHLGEALGQVLWR